MATPLENAKSLYMEGIRDGDYRAAIERYAADPYTQHSTPVRDGKQGFIEFFEDFIARNPERDIKIVRSFQDGQYVFLQAHQVLNGGEFQYVTADIFDSDESARLIEHWDIIEEVTPTSDGTVLELEGPVEPDPSADDAQAKRTVKWFQENVLASGDTASFSAYVAEDAVWYRQGIAAGSAPWHAWLEANLVRYQRPRLVVGSGDFVVALVEREVNGVPEAAMDIYRVVDGAITDYWDVAEVITPSATWVNSGKF